MPIFRRSVVPSATPGESSSVPESEPLPFSSFPNLLDFLQAVRWPDGTSRSPGTLLIFKEASMWKGCLNDRDAAQNAFFSARTLMGLFEQLDAAAGSGSGDWRAARPRGKGRG